MTRTVVLDKKQTCRLCGKTIQIGENALMFYNKKANPNVHFRHPMCQFKRFTRKETFETYMAHLKYEEEMKKTKRLVERTLHSEKLVQTLGTS